MSDSNQRVYGRSFAADVQGEHPEELEIAALGQAAGFFGPGVQLEVHQDYRARYTDDRDGDDRKTFRALVTVTEVLQER